MKMKIKKRSVKNQRDFVRARMGRGAEQRSRETECECARKVKREKL